MPKTQIHKYKSVPTIVTAPALSIAGNIISTTNGLWLHNPRADSFTYSWRYNGGAPVAGQTGSTFNHTAHTPPSPPYTVYSTVVCSNNAGASAGADSVGHVIS